MGGTRDLMAGNKISCILNADIQGYDLDSWIKGVVMLIQNSRPYTCQVESTSWLYLSLTTSCISACILFSRLRFRGTRRGFHHLAGSYLLSCKKLWTPFPNGKIRIAIFHEILNAVNGYMVTWKILTIRSWVIRTLRSVQYSTVQ